MPNNDNYDASNIDVLEGLEAVRKRPGMYIGSTSKEGLHHLVWEIVDNSIDEALAGFADEIVVILNKNKSVTVKDNGRGIPTDKHEKTGKSALETIMTILHAGGKFGGGGYKVSGGLHGVGASVVNALSSSMEVKVYKNSKIYFQKYSRGYILQEVEVIGDTDKTGTTVTFLPDPEIFQEVVDFDHDILAKRLKELAYLNRNISIKLQDDILGEEENYYFKGGIVEYVNELNSTKEVLNEEVFSATGESTDIIVDIAFQYNSGYMTNILSFVNNIATVDGGTHEDGFRSTLTRVLNGYAKKNNLLKDESLLGDDVREGLTAVISIKHRDPQFEGQTKGKLGSSDARVAVSEVLSEQLNRFLLENPKIARSYIEKGLAASRARMAAKKARELTRKKSTFESTSLPGKLADCSSKDPDISEIYIVEGDSAGGSAKQGRDRHYQAILPLRGKVINVEKASVNKIFQNAEILAIGQAIGTGIGQNFNIEKIRYKKIIIMTDADVDGAHIRTLLLTFFYRYMRGLIEEGYLYIAQPPLYKITQGKKNEYVYTEAQKEGYLKTIEGSRYSTQRYKGLGEMNPEQLWETTMDPETRTVVKINIEDAMLADNIFETLMGDETDPRKLFIQENAQYATIDI